MPDRDTTARSTEDVTFGVTSTLMQPVTQLYSARQGVRLAETAREADRAQLQADRADLVANVKRAGRSATREGRRRRGLHLR